MDEFTGSPHVVVVVHPILGHGHAVLTAVDRVDNRNKSCGPEKISNFSIFFNLREIGLNMASILNSPTAADEEPATRVINVEGDNSLLCNNSITTNKVRVGGCR